MKKIQNKAREQKGGFLNMLLGTSSVSVLGNMLPGKGVIEAGKGAIALSRGRGTIRAGQDF